VVSFTPRPLYPQGKSPGTPCIGGWVGPRAVLDAVVKRRIHIARNQNKKNLINGKEKKSKGTQEYSLIQYLLLLKIYNFIPYCAYWNNSDNEHFYRKLGNN
jgi:hypothetical protein